MIEYPSLVCLHVLNATPEYIRAQMPQSFGHHLPLLSLCSAPQNLLTFDAFDFSLHLVHDTRQSRYCVLHSCFLSTQPKQNSPVERPPSPLDMLGSRLCSVLSAVAFCIATAKLSVSVWRQCHEYTCNSTCISEINISSI